MKRAILVLAVLTLLTAAVWANPAFSVYVNDIFDVPLVAAPSTGYGWYLINFDKEFVEQVGQSFFRRVYAEDGEGQIEQQVFRFKALREGSTELAFEEKREGGTAEPRQTITIKIEITDQRADLIPDHPWTKSIVLIGSLRAGGMGTGFVVSESGYIVTANHVVSKFGMAVILLDPLAYKTARVVYQDEAHDIAVLKVDAENLRPLAVSCLHDNRIGDSVFVIGHPYGVGWMFTQGVLSAIKYDSDGYSYWLSDVEIEEGNSGSPLLNAKGEVIGIVLRQASGIAIGIVAEPFLITVTAAIQADQELAKIRKALERLQAREEREWSRLLEKIGE